VLESIHGKIIELAADSVVIDLGAVALRLRISAATARTLRIGEAARLHCHLRMREEEMTLYGFARAAERVAFDTLLGVSGLGPEKALALLSAFPPEVIARTIEDKDSKRFRTVRGIGDKLAQRIVLELTGKLDALARVAESIPATGSSHGTQRDLVATLTQLGYPRATAEVAAESAIRSGPPDATLEDLVKFALRNLLAARPNSSSES
jgi:holliday junction DNA helicase RuvA